MLRGLGWQAHHFVKQTAVPPAANFAVLPSSGAPTYTVTRNVLDSSGAVFAVPATVLDSAGTSYTPI